MEVEVRSLAYTHARAHKRRDTHLRLCGVIRLVSHVFIFAAERELLRVSDVVRAKQNQSRCVFAPNRPSSPERVSQDSSQVSRDKFESVQTYRVKSQVSQNKPEINV